MNENLDTIIKNAKASFDIDSLPVSEKTIKEAEKKVNGESKVMILIKDKGALPNVK